MPDEEAEAMQNSNMVTTQDMLVWDDSNHQTLYTLYGNTWALGRAACQQQGKDLCTTKTLKSSRTWSPVLDVCNAYSRESKNSWVPKGPILETAFPYWKGFLTKEGIEMPLSCCESAVSWNPHRHKFRSETIITDLKNVRRFKKSNAANLLRIVINHSQAGTQKHVYLNANLRSWQVFLLQ
jgi:hypothetical protein